MRRIPLERTLLVLTALWFWWGGEAPASAAPNPADRSGGPRLSIASPENGQAVAGRIQISVAFDSGASGPRASQLSLWVDGRMAYSRPVVAEGRRGIEYLDLDTRRLANGVHLLRVTMHAGPRHDAVASDEIRIEVNNGGVDTIPPLVFLRNYLDGDVVWGKIQLEAVATDGDQVGLLTIFVNRSPVLITNRPPFSVEIDTTRYSDEQGRGQIQVQAWAYDRAYNLGKSRLLTLNIDQSAAGRNQTPMRPDPAGAPAVPKPPAPAGDPPAPPNPPAPAGNPPAIANPVPAPIPPATGTIAPMSAPPPGAPRLARAEPVSELRRGVRSREPATVRYAPPSTRMAPPPVAAVADPGLLPAPGTPGATAESRLRSPATRPMSGAPSPADLRAAGEGRAPELLAAGGDPTPAPAAIARASELPEVRPMRAAPPPDAVRIEPGRIEVPLGVAAEPLPADAARSRPPATPLASDGRYYLLVMRPDAVPNERGRIELVPVAVDTVEARQARPIRRDRTHIVRRGETLATVARRYGVTPRSIRIASGLPDNAELRPGMRLRVPGTFRVAINEEDVRFDVPPRVDAGIPLAPLRHIFEHAGGTVLWIKETREVRASNPGTEVLVRIDSDRALLNGQEVQLDRPAFIDRGRTMVPVRFVEEALEMRAEYDPRTGTIHLVRR